MGATASRRAAAKQGTNQFNYLFLLFCATASSESDPRNQARPTTQRNGLLLLDWTGLDCPRPDRKEYCRPYPAQPNRGPNPHHTKQLMHEFAHITNKYCY